MCKAVGCGDRVWKTRFRFCGYHWNRLPQTMRHRIKSLRGRPDATAVYVISAARFWILIREHKITNWDQAVAACYPKRYTYQGRQLGPAKYENAQAEVGNKGPGDSRKGANVYGALVVPDRP